MGCAACRMMMKGLGKKQHLGSDMCKGPEVGNAGSVGGVPGWGSETREELEDEIRERQGPQNMSCRPQRLSNLLQLVLCSL